MQGYPSICSRLSPKMCRSSSLLLGTFLCTLCHVLMVFGLEPSFPELIQNVTVPVNRNATLSCIVDNLQGYRVAWMKADTETVLTIHMHVITHNSRVRVSRNGIRQWNLHIDSVQEGDRGMYMCQVNTVPMKKLEGYLEIVVPPDIIEDETSSDLFVNEGQSVSLTCRATGYPKPTITWRKEDNELITVRVPPKQKIRVHNITSETLNMSRVHRRHMGVYLCIASNGVPPSVSKRVRLQVNFQPQVKVPNQLVAAPIGAKVELECYMDVSPLTASYWMKNRQPIFDSSKYKTETIFKSSYKNTMKLTIRDLEPSDFDIYSCVSKNTLGEAQGVIRLRELDFPSTSTKLEIEEKIGGHQISHTSHTDLYSSHKSPEMTEKPPFMYGMNYTSPGQKYDVTIQNTTAVLVKNLPPSREWKEGSSASGHLRSAPTCALMLACVSAVCRLVWRFV